MTNYQEKGENVGKLQKKEKVGGQIVKRRKGGPGKLQREEQIYNEKRVKGANY